MPKRIQQYTPYILSLTLVFVALILALLLWKDYWLYHPWTRDGQVRTHVLRLAARVSGPIIKLHVKDNQYVMEGELLYEIDPATFIEELERAKADVQTAIADRDEARLQMERREGVPEPLIAAEELSVYQHRFKAAQAVLIAKKAAAQLAELNLQYTLVYAPADGYITTLNVYEGNYITVGMSSMSLVKSKDFYVEGYFKETRLQAIHPGAKVTIKLMAYRNKPIEGVVSSISRGITARNGSVGIDLLANVAPTIDWIRLAQRIPVRIHFINIPEGIELSAGMTATLFVHPNKNTSYDTN